MLDQREHQKPYRYFTVAGETPTSAARPERVRAAIITSMRDLIVEKFCVQPDADTSDFVPRIKGTLEHAIIQSTRGRLAHCLDIVVVIHDDTERDMHKLDNVFPLTPEREKPWVHPLNLRNRQGDLVTTITRHIPSNYRLLPLTDTEGRATEKQRFEERIRLTMEMHGAEILISDHFLCRIEHLINPHRYDLWNKVLNTHPGISDTRHRFRNPGVTPYIDAIKRARGENGVRHNLTGASFHLIRTGIDDGPVLMDAECTPVYPGDDWPALCRRNYPNSKNPVFVEGVLHYLHYVYPHLEKIDPEELQPYETDQPVYGAA